MTFSKKKLAKEQKLRDNSEASSRLQNLEFSGIPKSDPEPRHLLKQRVFDIAQKLGANITLKDIDDAHRKISGGVIVRFVSRDPRNELFQYTFKPDLKPKLKELTTDAFPSWPVTDRGRKIFMNESLTDDRARLARVCRDKVKHINQEEGRSGQQRYRVSSNNGQVTVQDSMMRWRKIRSVNDFDNLHPNDIPETEFDN